MWTGSSALWVTCPPVWQGDERFFCPRHKSGINTELAGTDVIHSQPPHKKTDLCLQAAW